MLSFLNYRVLFDFFFPPKDGTVRRQTLKEIFFSTISTNKNKDIHLPLWNFDIQSLKSYLYNSDVITSGLRSIASFYSYAFAFMVLAMVIIDQLQNSGNMIMQDNWLILSISAFFIGQGIAGLIVFNRE